MRFTDRAAFVTGGAQGIGAATASVLAAGGARVAVVDLTADRAESTVERITSDGGRAAATAERVGATPGDHQKHAAANTPLRRVGQPEEVASVIAFLASDEVSYVSGQTLYVNGGAR